MSETSEPLTDDELRALRPFRVTVLQNRTYATDHIVLATDEGTAKEIAERNPWSDDYPIIHEVTDSEEQVESEQGEAEDVEELDVSDIVNHVGKELAPPESFERWAALHTPKREPEPNPDGIDLDYAMRQLSDRVGPLTPAQLRDRMNRALDALLRIKGRFNPDAQHNEG